MSEPLDCRTGPDLARTIVRFCRALREEGLAVPVSSVQSYARALGALGARSAADVYWAGRATLVLRPEDTPSYDRVFATFWCGETAEDPARHGARAPIVTKDGANHRAGASPGAERQRQLRYSRAEMLRHKDFSACSEEELAEAMELLRWRPAISCRPSHRWEPGRRGRRLDVRATMRHAMRCGGEVVPTRRLERSPRDRRLVVLCDVSGSMEPYARAMLRFAHVLVAGQSRVEAFAIGTRLTRLTRELSSRDPDAAMTTAAAVVRDWSGGTRLGEGLREFNDRFGVRGMARGAEVIVMSDGWDRGDPEELGAQMSRLKRVAHRVVWMNPLKADPRYEPLARGMAAALPHVDRFLPGHDMASLESLLAVLESP